MEVKLKGVKEMKFTTPESLYKWTFNRAWRLRSSDLIVKKNFIAWYVGDVRIRAMQVRSK